MSKRTTLTLEDDVAAGLDWEVRRTGKPFKTVVNEAIRRGLDHRSKRRTKYRVKARNLGLRAGMELDDIHGLIERIEGPDHR